MKNIEIPVGQSQQLLRLEPQQQANQFKIYAVDKAQDWINREEPRSVDIPPDGLLGTITIHSEKKFEFDGSGAFTGQDLQSIAAQVVRHPDFRPDEKGG